MIAWRTWSTVALAAAGAILAGCNGSRQSVSATPPAPVARADEMLLRTSTVAVDLDGEPGPDGVAARVELFKAPGALPVAVKGTLEFYLYEGVVAPDALSKAKPFRIWRFAGPQLSPYLVRGIVGWGYTVPLSWGKNAPMASAVTLSARYVDPDGRSTYAMPVTIALTAR